MLVQSSRFDNMIAVDHQNESAKAKKSSLHLPRFNSRRIKGQSQLTSVHENTNLASGAFSKPNFRSVISGLQNRHCGGHGSPQNPIQSWPQGSFNSQGLLHGCLLQKSPHLRVHLLCLHFHSQGFWKKCKKYRATINTSKWGFFPITVRYLPPLKIESYFISRASTPKANNKNWPIVVFSFQCKFCHKIAEIKNVWEKAFLWKYRSAPSPEWTN